jgi:hypothetical protein
VKESDDSLAALCGFSSVFDFQERECWAERTLSPSVLIGSVRRFVVEDTRGRTL